MRLEAMAAERFPFTFAIASRNRDTGSVSDYSIFNIRHYPGDWKVTATVAPFTATGNDVLELAFRGANIRSESSDPSGGWTSVLTMIPTICEDAMPRAPGVAGHGVFYVSNGWQGPLDVSWTDTSDADAAVDETNFPEHTIHLEFTPL